MKLPFGFVGFASFILVAWCRLLELSWLLILSLGRQWRRRRGTAEPAGTGSGHKQSRVALVIHFSFIRYKMVASWRGTARCEAQRRARRSDSLACAPGNDIIYVGVVVVILVVGTLLLRVLGTWCWHWAALWFRFGSISW